jgi:hypothetical protein
MSLCTTRAHGGFHPPHSSTFPRNPFTSPRTFFALIRRSTDPRVGFVGRRFFGTTVARRINSARRTNTPHARPTSIR